MKFAKLYLLAVIVLLCFSSNEAKANETPTNVLLEVGSSVAVVDGENLDLNIAPFIAKGNTMVPLRFLAESFGAAVNWDKNSNVITIDYNAKKLVLNKNSGNKENIPDQVIIEDNTAMVPLRMIMQKFGYSVKYEQATKKIKMSKLPPPNQKPIALFEIPETVAQGEKVTYKDLSYDPDGDGIISRKWEGYEEVFFKAGNYKVSLSVRDSKGEWSEPFVKTIKVTDEVKMDMLGYYLQNPLSGKKMDISKIPVLNLIKINPVVTMKKENVFISNSPETILEDGILYSDILKGNNRLYYHHYNGSKETKKILLIAANNGEKPAKIAIKRQGIAGPSNPMAVGQLAAYNFLSFDASKTKTVELSPGDEYIFNNEEKSEIKPGQAIHGIFNIETNNGVLFYVVAVGQKTTEKVLQEMPILARDSNHIRGTFEMPSRDMTVRINANEPSRLVIADGQDDSFLIGKDNNTGKYGLVTKNWGNYGVIYNIYIETKYRIGVLLNPRGGVFAGAGKWGDKTFLIPDQGILKPQVEGALIGVLNPGENKELKIVPPAGSYLPINLLFIPF